MDLHFQGLKDSYFAGMEQYEERQTAYLDNQFLEFRNMIQSTVEAQNAIIVILGISRCRIAEEIECIFIVFRPRDKERTEVTDVLRILGSTPRSLNLDFLYFAFWIYQSWKSRLSERFSPERERITWEGEILGYTGGFSPERELSRLGEKWQFGAVDTREKRALQEQRALGLILELEKRVNMNAENEDVKNK
ncbi:hypothetical protein Lal_00031450, partial [Lupinus albus]